MNKTIKKLLIGMIVFNTYTSIETIQAQETQETTQQEQLLGEPYDSPLELIEALKTGEHLASNLNLLYANENSDYDVNSRAFIKDEDHYYFVTRIPGEVSSAALIETKEGQYTQSYILAEDVAKFAAEALNLYPDMFQETNIEKFYIFAQENPEKIKGIHINNLNMAEMHQQLLDDSIKIDQFLLSVFQEMVQSDLIQPKIEEVEGAGQIQTYAIDTKAAEQLAKIANDLAKEDETLQLFVQMFEQGYIGSLGFALATGDMALSIASPDGLSVLEYIIGQEQATINLPKDEQIISVDEFNQMTGIELF